MNKDIEKTFTIIILIFTFWVCFLIIEINNLNKRIEDLEKQSKEVHEYILNRIGG